MNKFAIRANNLISSQAWLSAFEIRESKKAQCKPVQNHNGDQFTLNAGNLLKTRVIFTGDNVGKSSEETQKIQRIHTELEDLPLIPNYAFC